MQGKESAFNVRNNPLKEEKIERFMKRKQITEGEILSQPSPVPGKDPPVSVLDSRLTIPSYST